MEGEMENMGERRIQWCNQGNSQLIKKSTIQQHFIAIPTCILRTLI